MLNEEKTFMMKKDNFIICPHDEVHADCIAGHFVLRNDERTAPVVVERLLLPLGERLAVDVARAVSAVYDRQQHFLTQVLMR